MEQSYLKFQKFDSWSFFALIAAIVLPLVWVVPSEILPFQLSKTVLFTVGIVLSLLLFIAARFREQQIQVPYPLPLILLPLIPLAYLASALFSQAGTGSLFGEEFSADSVAFIAMSALALALTVFLLRTRSQILFALTVVLAAFFVIAFLHVGALLAGADALRWSGALEQSDTLVGKLQDTAFLYGLVTILSLVTLAGIRVRGWVKVMLIVALSLSLFLLAVIDLDPLWWVIGAVALATLVFSFYKHTNKTSEKTSVRAPAHVPDAEGSGGISFAALAVLGVAFIFLVSEGWLTGFLASTFETGQVSVRPSWQSTLTVAGEVYTNHFILGSGPGSFGTEWALYRPAGLNTSPFWNIDFASGVGFLPTSFITTGVLGAIVWLGFLGSLLYMGFRALVVRPAEESFSYYLSLASFLGTVYLWTVSVLFSPSSLIIGLTFVFSGLFIASLRTTSGSVPEFRFKFQERPRWGFVTVLGFALIFLIAVTSLLKVGELYVAKAYERKAAVWTSEDPARAQELAAKSFALRPSDTSARIAAAAALRELSTLAASPDAALPDAAGKLQALIDRAVANAETATQIDPADYENWFALGQVYHAFLPLNIEGAYERAEEAYNGALARRPESPVIMLALAHLEREAGNTDTAQAAAEKALAARPQYTEAMFFLAQLQIEAGNLEEAITAVEEALAFAPNNPVVYFQLGLLRYSAKDYVGAEQALARSVALRENYANARYFLGLSYFYLDRRDESIAQFERVSELNPDNSEVATILENLHAGRDPLATIAESPSVAELDGPPLEENLEVSADESEEDNNEQIEEESAEANVEEVPAQSPIAE